MNSEKVCLYSPQYIKWLNDYFITTIEVRGLFLDNYNTYFHEKYGKFFAYIYYAMKIILNEDVHDDLIRIDGTHEPYVEKTRDQYTSITQKFKDWKHLTLMVDKTTEEVMEYIGTVIEGSRNSGVKFKNAKNFMEGFGSRFRMQKDIEKKKKAFCITNKRGELNMSLKQERSLVDLGGRRRSRRIAKTKIASLGVDRSSQPRSLGTRITLPPELACSGVWRRRNLLARTRNQRFQVPYSAFCVSICPAVPVKQVN